MSTKELRFNGNKVYHSGDMPSAQEIGAVSAQELQEHTEDANIHTSTQDKQNLNNAYSHSIASHAPSNAQRNADITKAEIEAKLVGNITSHTHSGVYEPVITAKNTAFNVNFETTATNIKMDGVQSAGVLSTAARADHVHPVDTSRAAASHNHTGVYEPIITTKNSAYNVNFETNSANIKMDGTQSAGTLSTVAKADHVHPTDTTRAAASHTHGDSDITGIDAAKITKGTISIDRLPQSAIERLIVVANQAARYALTIDLAQNGDVVKQMDNGSLYYIVDDTKLNQALGYEVFSTGTASSVAWAGITGKPTTVSGYGITDASTVGHTHTKANITDFPALATVATSGSYNDLTNKPTIPTTLPANGGNADTLDGKHASEFATIDNCNALSLIDLNNYATPGLQGVTNNNCTNQPASGYYYIFNFVYNNTNIKQLAYEYNGGRMFARYRYSGTWSSWVEYSQSTHTHTKANITDFAHTHTSADLPSNVAYKDGTLQTGLNAEKIGGKTISQIATIDKDNNQPLEISEWIDFHKVGSNTDYDTRLFIDHSTGELYRAIGGVSKKILNQDDLYTNNYGVTSGTSTAYAVTLSNPPTTYNDGMQITILPHVDSGATPTLNINGLGALTIVKQDGSSIAIGDIKANKPLSLVRVGSNFFIRSGGLKKGDVILPSQIKPNTTTGSIIQIELDTTSASANRGSKITGFKHNNIAYQISYTSNIIYKINDTGIIGTINLPSGEGVCSICGILDGYMYCISYNSLKVVRVNLNTGTLETLFTHTIPILYAFPDNTGNYFLVLNTSSSTLRYVDKTGGAIWDRNVYSNWASQVLHTNGENEICLYLYDGSAYKYIKYDNTGTQKLNMSAIGAKIEKSVRRVGDYIISINADSYTVNLHSYTTLARISAKSPLGSNGSYSYNAFTDIDENKNLVCNMGSHIYNVDFNNTGKDWMFAPVKNSISYGNTLCVYKINDTILYINDNVGKLARVKEYKEVIDYILV